MLAKLNDVLQGTLTGGFAVPAFNVFGYEDAKSIIDAAEELHLPVILATNKTAINYMPIEIFGPLLTGLAEKASVPVVVHLDHGQDYQTIARAIKNGYSSVMYDGSNLPFEKNVETTREIVKLAHAFDIPVEAEIGSVGYSDLALGINGELTDPFEAKEFTEKTGVDALAISVGTVHRMENQSANIQYDRIEQIEALVSVPLVMHGSTGLQDEDLKRIAGMRFGKVNIGTAIRMSFGKTLQTECNAHPQMFDRIELFKEPMEAVKQTAIYKMKLLNAGKRNAKITF